VEVGTGRPSLSPAQNRLIQGLNGLGAAVAVYCSKNSDELRADSLVYWDLDVLTKVAYAQPQLVQVSSRERSNPLEVGPSKPASLKYVPHSRPGDC